MHVDVTRLKNGLVVATNEMPALESAAIGVWVNCGARCETRARMGISHMLEHMAFKGTHKRSAREISSEIEDVGGVLNAYTGREQTAYHARMLKNDVPLALDILSDILLDPVYAPNELERERQVILQEIGEVRDTPDDLIFDLLQEACYPDQPMGFPVLGDEDTVSGMARDDLFAYLKSHYHAGNMVLSASGAVKHEDIVRMAEEKFSSLAASEVPAPAPAVFHGSEIRKTAKLEQVHVAMAFPSVSASDPDYFAAQVYAMALGGGMSSRLFQEVREKRGLCYSIYAYGQSVRDHGVVGIYTGTSPKGAEELGPVIAGEMEAMADTAEADEVNRAKAQLRAGLLMGIERPGTRCEMIAGHFLHYGRVIPVEEVVAKLDAVDVDAVRAFGRKVMESSHPALSVVGAAEHFESYDQFQARFGSDRAMPSGGEA